MHRLKHMKEALVAQVENQMSNLSEVDTHELGEVIDMIKDLEEAIYYCSITKAMEEKEEEKKVEHHYYTTYIPERDIDRDEWGRMYYPRMRDSQGRYLPEGRDGTRDGGGRRDYVEFPALYHEREIPIGLRDEREGRSPITRRMYMESKELHKDKTTKLKELEQYMKELSEDIVEMISDATPEERQLLEKKVAALSTKIQQVNTSANAQR